MDDTTKKQIEDIVDAEIQEQLSSGTFLTRKITDTPTDSLSVVNRKFVTLNGLTANRPTSSITGQCYLDLTLAAGKGKPVWWNGTGWIDATGNYT